MNILDKRFVYVPACSTDIRKTFERIRQEQAAQKRVHVNTDTFESKSRIHGTPEFYRLWRAK